MRFRPAIKRADIGKDICDAAVIVMWTPNGGYCSEVARISAGGPACVLMRHMVLVCL